MLTRPRVMAILNVTTDSFFDGGQFMDVDARGEAARVEVGRVLARAREFVRDGATILDIGGESTRPGAAAVAPEVERARVLPALIAMTRDPELAEVPVSVDTRRAAVARAAVAAGAAIVNDISGLADPAMADVIAETGAGVVVGHLRGVPASMQRAIAFHDLLVEVGAELRASVERALRAGVARERIVVDPGIGFGKTAEQSAALVAAASLLREETGCPVLIGASRKSFLGAITARPVERRGPGSVAAALLAVRHGASVVRVHDVAATVDALRVARAVEEAHARARSPGGDTSRPRPREFVVRSGAVATGDALGRWTKQPARGGAA